jgi:hypothetical protein
LYEIILWCSNAINVGMKGSVMPSHSCSLPLILHIITVLVGYNIGIPFLLEVRVHVWVAQSVMRSLISAPLQGLAWEGVKEVMGERRTYHNTNATQTAL